MARRVPQLVGALVGCLAIGLVLPRLAQPDRSPRRVPLVRRQPGATATTNSNTANTGASAAGLDPNLPLYVGDSRRLAASAIDSIAAAGLDTALVELAERFLGSPERSSPAGATSQERLELDLTGFDQLSFVEQLLALANSRRVRGRTEAADRFSDHVRQLRYGGGRVERCARLRQPSLWAVAAQRRGYLVDLSPYLPGARQRRVSLQALFEDPSAPPSQATSAGQPCRVPARKDLELTLAELPLGAMPSALPSLRHGDLVLLRGPIRDPIPDGIGVVEMRSGRPAALLLQPGRGVMRAGDLMALARGRPGTTAVAFLRPLPNQDGRPDR